ncbi:uridine kinase [Asanoa sp. WMMD1127]|uniref:uridine kinase n=1 Tax=Asanoa sp. WMMD1127 TaxID=3016107 RepID=UPI002416224E|nr:uridine kinase [Asanoa sp. WMMD1127]MDG4826483.1 uridine kinase [Asanoa sp. WMMD1127]
MRVRPITPELFVEDLAERIVRESPETRLRVALDGPPPADGATGPLAGPDLLAAALVEELRLRGRPAHVVPAGGFLRAASLRFEQGRTNPDAFYTDWLDEAGLRREVLDPAGPDGSGRILPSLWDPATDRASRAAYRTLESTAAVLVTGGFLLGGGLAFDLTVHLAVSPAALARRTPAEWAWTLPAWERYADEVDPAGWADVVVRTDDPRHPALVRRE